MILFNAPHVKSHVIIPFRIEFWKNFCFFQELMIFFLFLNNEISVILQFLLSWQYMLELTYILKLGIMSDFFSVTFFFLKHLLIT